MKIRPTKEALKAYPFISDKEYKSGDPTPAKEVYITDDEGDILLLEKGEYTICEESDLAGLAAREAQVEIEKRNQTVFEVGDKVRCINDGMSGIDFLKEGLEYTVYDVLDQGNNIILEDDPSGTAWITSRFVLAAREAQADRDPVKHPGHYDLPDEVIKLIRRNLTPEEFAGYCKGNILKYTCRSALKNGEQDWQKAAMYMKWLAEVEG